MRYFGTAQFLLPRRQAVRHLTLTQAFGGSNPSGAARHQRPDRKIGPFCCKRVRPGGPDHGATGAHCIHHRSGPARTGIARPCERIVLASNQRHAPKVRHWRNCAPDSSTYHAVRRIRRQLLNGTPAPASDAALNSRSIPPATSLPPTRHRHDATWLPCRWRPERRMHRKPQNDKSPAWPGF